jgi:serine/threonine-protein kinase
LQVAQALELAHARRLLHRDIKPDNVMVGAFGEVYLVDWGIAVALDDTVHGVPLARAVSRVEGTPVYLAPEMAAAEGRSIDERSDVYLLGATLFEVLTGEPPHAGPHLHAILCHAITGRTAELPVDAPAPLARIARKALAREPSDRYGSVAELAEAVREYLVHRSSMQLAVEGLERTAELQDLAAAGAGLGPELRGLFHEARFAFDQALSGWPGNQEAREGRRALIGAMVTVELAQGSPAAAQLLLDTLEEPPGELTAEVGRAVEAERLEKAHLEAVARDADIEVGKGARQALAYLAAVTWAGTCIACGVLTRTGALPIDHDGFGLINGGFLMGTIAGSYLFRREAMATAVSRRVTYHAILIFAAGTVLWPFLGTLGLSMPETTVVGALVASFIWAGAVISVGFPWLPQALGQLVIVALAWEWPVYHFEIYGVVGGLQTLLAAHLIGKQTSPGHNVSAG